MLTSTATEPTGPPTVPNGLPSEWEGDRTPVALTARLRSRMLLDVQRTRADLVLLFCYAITGLLDSTAVSAWGSFVSMQTGNSVFIGLGLAAPTASTRWIKSAVSLGCFCIGSVLFSRFHRRFSPKRRWVLCASFAAQTALTAAAAAIVTFGPASTSTSLAWNVLVPVALIALQSCAQAVTSRALGYNSLTSVVLTSIYCDLFSDPFLLAQSNVERNRRVAAPLMLILGAVAGGLFIHSPFGIPGALWTATLMKLGVVLAWLFFPSQPAPE